MTGWLDRAITARWEGKRATAANLPERFWAKVKKTETCWLWRAGTGGKGKTQYGIFTATPGEPHTSAHRIAYELAIGPIPTGMVVDHLCGTTLCVRPDHLEAVTPLENRRRQAERKTHCVRGHPLSGANLYEARGRRYCRECRRTYRSRKPCL